MSDIDFMIFSNYFPRHFDQERAATKKKERKLRGMLKRVGTFVFSAACSVILGSIGAVDRTLAITVGFIAMLAASFAMGQFVEATRK